LSRRVRTSCPTVFIAEDWCLRGRRVVGFTSFPRHVAVRTVSIAQRFLCRFAPAGFSQDCTTEMVTPTPARVAWRAVLDGANAHGRFAGRSRVRQADMRVIRLLAVINYGCGRCPQGDQASGERDVPCPERGGPSVSSWAGLWTAIGRGAQAGQTGRTLARDWQTSSSADSSSLATATAIAVRRAAGRV
jgi:hypothetical protein